MFRFQNECLTKVGNLYSEKHELLTGSSLGYPSLLVTFDGVKWFYHHGNERELGFVARGYVTFIHTCT